jgi:hypothetical protein
MSLVFSHSQRWDDDRAPYPGLDVLTADDYKIAVRILKGPRKADLVIAPDGKPYLYRWHLFHLDEGLGFGQYLHIQVASDPERPLHDHPWDNSSVILAGGYVETLDFNLDGSDPLVFTRKVGDMVHRVATVAHRLELPDGVPYTMTLFTMGPKIREWGFWYPDGWVHNKEVVRTVGDISTHMERM